MLEELPIKIKATDSVRQHAPRDVRHRKVTTSQFIESHRQIDDLFEKDPLLLPQQRTAPLIWRFHQEARTVFDRPKRHCRRCIFAADLPGLPHSRCLSLNPNHLSASSLNAARRRAPFLF